MNLFMELHKNIPREGPGNNESTTKAYQKLKKYISKPFILDIGCGPGMQTIVLAELTDGKITATDINEGFLEVLRGKVEQLELTETVHVEKANMKDLPYAEGQFELIWSEGAIYIIGFENGLREWRKFLKENGILVVSELSWLKENPPELIIRPITEEDLPNLWSLIYKEDSPEWKKWDAPYFEHKSIPYDEFKSQKQKWVNQKDRWVIEVISNVIGTVGYYWEHKPSNWLEMGIVIYNPNFWSGGYGTKTLLLWINHLFQTLPLVRVGFTTWSGNERMIKVGEKLGMKMEARLRKCRYYKGEYYDSIRMGLLREEWEANSIFTEG